MIKMDLRFSDLSCIVEGEEYEVANTSLKIIPVESPNKNKRCKGCIFERTDCIQDDIRASLPLCWDKNRKQYHFEYKYTKK